MSLPDRSTYHAASNSCSVDLLWPGARDNPMAMPAFLLRLGELDRDTLLRAAAERAPLAVSAVLVVAIAAVLAGNVMRLLAPPSPPDPVRSRPPASDPRVDVGSILNAHLFGRAQAGAVDPAMAPVSAANLFLAGTMAGASPEHGWAILGENAQSARVVETGSTLAGGTVLRAVYPDRVVIERDGRVESVMLPRLSGAAGPYPLRAASSDAGAMIDAVRQAIGSPATAARVGEVVRPQPVFANGTLRGVRAYPGSNRRVFTALGLQPGDLVTAINGAQLDDVQRATGTLRDLGREPVQLTVERSGRAQQITVDPTAVAQNVAEEVAGSDDEPPMGEP